MANVRKQTEQGPILGAAKRRQAERHSRKLRDHQRQLKAEAEARRRGTG